MRLIDADALMPNAEYKGRYDVVTAYDIANAPTIEPEPQWIPCSKRLPKKPCECLATVEVQIWESSHRIVRRTKFANGRFKGVDKVLAWMPLPEPYGGEQE